MKLAWAALLLALGSCDREPDAPCQSGHAAERHSFESRGVMIFMRGNATLLDAVTHRVYGVAEFGAQPQHVLASVDSKAKSSRLEAFKTTVSVTGYAFTCLPCGKHEIVVSSMTSSAPSEFSHQDFESYQKEIRSWPVSAKPLPAECLPVLH